MAYCPDKIYLCQTSHPLTPTLPHGQNPTAGLKSARMIIPNPSFAFWILAECSGKANPVINLSMMHWTSWKQRWKKSLMKLEAEMSRPQKRWSPWRKNLYGNHCWCLWRRRTRHRLALLSPWHSYFPFQGRMYYWKKNITFAQRRKGQSAWHVTRRWLHERDFRSSWMAGTWNGGAIGTTQAGQGWPANPGSRWRLALLERNGLRILKTKNAPRTYDSQGVFLSHLCEHRSQIPKISKIVSAVSFETVVEYPSWWICQTISQKLN